MKGHAGEVAEEDKSKCQVGGLIVVSPKVVEIKMILFITCRAGVIASIPQGQPQEGRKHGLNYAGGGSPPHFLLAGLTPHGTWQPCLLWRSHSMTPKDPGCA